jgi:hypothetical protein
MTELGALQAALAAEHATVYGYGVAGAILRGDDRSYAATALDAHMMERDKLIALIRSLHGTPVAPLPAYQLPSPVTTAKAARDLAAHLEQGDAGALWDLIAASASGSPVRSSAIAWLSESAVRAAHWGAKQALPGQPQPAT